MERTPNGIKLYNYILMNILIIKNGVCDTDIDKLLLEINNKLKLHIKYSKTLDYESFDIMNYYAVIILGGSQSLADTDDIIKNHSYLIIKIIFLYKSLKNGRI